MWNDFLESPLDAVAKASSALPPVAARSGSVTRLGFTRSNPKAWRDLVELWDNVGYGEAISGANRSFIARGIAPRVDADWIKWFPEDAGLLGERVTMHHIGGSGVTVPLSTTRHLNAHMPGGYRYNPGGPGSLWTDKVDMPMTAELQVQRLLFFVEGVGTPSTRNSMAASLRTLQESYSWIIAPPNYIDPIGTHIGGVSYIYSSNHLPLELDQVCLQETERIIDAMREVSAKEKIGIVFELDGIEVGAIESGIADKSLSAGLLGEWRKELLRRARQAGTAE